MLAAVAPFVSDRRTPSRIRKLRHSQDLQSCSRKRWKLTSHNGAVPLDTDVPYKNMHLVAASAGSELQLTARQTRLRTLKLLRWPCDATAELRDSAETQDIDQRPRKVPMVIVSAIQRRRPNFLAPSLYLAHSLGNSKSPSSRAFKVAFGLADTTILFEVLVRHVEVSQYARGQFPFCLHHPKVAVFAARSFCINKLQFSAPKT